MGKPRFRLFRDDELGVLWLTAGRSEVALSSDGVWLKAGRRVADLPWREIEQVQQSEVRRGRARIELFRADGSSFCPGPFPAAKGEQWIRAAGEAARRAGWVPRPLEGAVGFALTGAAQD